MLLYLFAAVMVIAAIATALNGPIWGAAFCGIVALIAIYLAVRSGGKFT